MASKAEIELALEKRREEKNQEYLDRILPKVFSALDTAGITYSEDQLEHSNSDGFNAGHDSLAPWLAEAVELIDYQKSQWEAIGASGHKHTVVWQRAEAFLSKFRKEVKGE